MGKKQEDYTIHNVLHHIPKFLAETMDNEQLNQFKSNLSYLNSIASSMTYAKVSARSFTNTFADKPFYEYTPQEINKALAECLQAPTPVATDFQEARLEACKDSKLLKYDTSKLEIQVNDLESEIRGYRDSIDSYNKRINDYLRCMCKSQQRLDEVQLTLEHIDKDGKNQEVVAAIQEIIDSGKWLYLGSWDDSISRDERPKMLRHSPYNTANDFKVRQSIALAGHIFMATEKTVCSHISRDAKAIKRANFGNLVVCLNQSGQIIKAFFGLDAYASDLTCLHPHISSSGDVCWGNAGSAYSNLVRDSRPNYMNILTLFTSLMETYSPDNPYQRLDVFMDKNVVKRHPILIDPTLLSYVPTEFLREQLSEEQIAEYQLEQATKILREQYLETYTRNDLILWENLPDGLRSKLGYLSSEYKRKFKELIDNGTHSSDIEAEHLISEDALTDQEWSILAAGYRAAHNIQETKAMLFAANYVRWRATGKQLAVRKSGSKPVWCEFTPDHYLTFDEPYCTHFVLSMKTATFRDEAQDKICFSHPDDVDAFAPTFNDYRSAQ